MKKPRSFRRRIVVALLGSGAILVVAFAVTAGLTLFSTEDEIQQNQLLVELEFLLQRDDLADEEIIHVSRFMTAYVGLNSMPADLQVFLAPLGEGVHKLFFKPEQHQSGLDSDFQVAIAPMPDRAELLYLVFDVSDIDPNQRPLIYALFAGLAVVSVLLVFLGFTLTAPVVRPLSDLAHLVRSANPDELSEKIHPDEYDEEIGVLARAMRDTIARLHGFIQREREFTGNASHELRTPLTVIRGATEVIELQTAAQEEAVRRPLDRILFAVSEMEETIDIFLELAREDSVVGDIDCCSVRQVVEDVVESHRHVLADRPVEIEIRVPDDVVVETSERALSIVLGNLIGNALSRTEKGAVTIDWREGGVDIADTGPGIHGRDLGRVTDRHFTGNGGGYGLGLSIVQTLCGEFGWRLELKPETPGTVVRLTFDQ